MHGKKRVTLERSFPSARPECVTDLFSHGREERTEAKKDTSLWSGQRKETVEKRGQGSGQRSFFLPLRLSKRLGEK